MNKKTNQRAHKLRSSPGPKPDVLKFNGKWQDAVKQSLQKKKSANGWPK